MPRIKYNLKWLSWPLQVYISTLLFRTVLCEIYRHVIFRIKIPYSSTFNVFHCFWNGYVWGIKCFLGTSWSPFMSYCEYNPALVTSPSPFLHMSSTKTTQSYMHHFWKSIHCSMVLGKSLLVRPLCRQVSMSLSTKHKLPETELVVVISTSNAETKLHHVSNEDY